MPTRAALASNRHESYSLGTPSTSYADRTCSVPARDVCTYVSGGSHRVRDYRITSIFRYLCRHSRHNDAEQAVRPSLSWILTTLKLTRFLAKEEAPRRLPSEGRRRESVFRVQFRRKLNCPNEKSLFRFLLTLASTDSDMRVFVIKLYLLHLFIAKKKKSVLHENRCANLSSDLRDDFSIHWCILY